MTAQNHWGKWVDSSEPITGVISANNIAWECIDNEICITCEEIIADIENDGTLDDDEKWDESCNIECDDHEKLIGDWLKDDEGLYYPDEHGEFAAIVTSSTFSCVQVVWSKWIAKNKRLCSPCFPNQADLDSENGKFTCYALPKDLVSYEDYEVEELK
jgi:hypothetical protein